MSDKQESSNRSADSQSALVQDAADMVVQGTALGYIGGIQEVEANLPVELALQVGVLANFQIAKIAIATVCRASDRKLPDDKIDNLTVDKLIEFANSL